MCPLNLKNLKDYFSNPPVMPSELRNRQGDRKTELICILLFSRNPAHISSYGWIGKNTTKALLSIILFLGRLTSKESAKHGSF